MLAKILRFIILLWFRRQATDSVHRLQLKGVKAYIQFVRSSRAFYLAMLAALTASVVLIFAIGMGLTGLFILLPWPLETKAWILTISGSFAILLTIFVICYSVSEKLWMRLSGAEELLRKTLERD